MKKQKKNKLTKKKKKQTIKDIITKENIIKYLKLSLNIVINFLNKYKYVFFLLISFIIMDIITRIFGSSINYYKLNRLAPNLFTLSWAILFTGLTISFKKSIGKRIYLFFAIIFLILFLTNNVYYSMTRTFFDFNLIESASEGAPYIIDT